MAKCSYYIPPQDRPELPSWETAANPRHDQMNTRRLRLDDGWLYSIETVHGAALAFVRDSQD